MVVALSLEQVEVNGVIDWLSQDARLRTRLKNITGFLVRDVEKDLRLTCPTTRSRMIQIDVIYSNLLILDPA